MRIGGKAQLIDLKRVDGATTKEAALSLTRTRAGAGVAEQVDRETLDGYKLGAHQG